MSLIDQIRFTHRAWRFRLRDDRAEIRFLREHVTRGSAAIDIGAHKGAYTYWMRRGVGEHGRVVAFEPQPALADALAAIVRQRRWLNVEVEQAALWHESTTMTLAIPDGSGATSPGAHIVRGSAGSGEQTLSIRALRLDDYLAGRAHAISFIKCDVEGAELSVFRGGERVLREDRPALLFECEQRHHEDGAIGRVFGYLAGLGYTGRFFVRGRLRPIAEFDAQKHQPQSGERFFDEPGYCNNFAFVAGPSKVV